VREVVQIDVEAGGAEGAGCGACPASEGEVCAESRESVCLGGVVACGVLGFDAICDNAAVPTIVVACQVCAPSHQPTNQPTSRNNSSGSEEWCLLLPEMEWLEWKRHDMTWSKVKRSGMKGLTSH
jgi:hypothetical protein